mgnify:FL=1
MPGCDGYYGAAAHMMQADRRARERKLIKHPELCKRVIERIKNGWIVIPQKLVLILETKRITAR